MTPAMVTALPDSQIVLPTIAGIAVRRDVQNRWFTTTTGGEPGSSSEGSNVRPGRHGRRASSDTRRSRRVGNRHAPELPRPQREPRALARDASTLRLARLLAHRGKRVIRPCVRHALIEAHLHADDRRGIVHAVRTQQLALRMVNTVVPTAIASASPPTVAPITAGCLRKSRSPYRRSSSHALGPPGRIAAATTWTDGTGAH